MAYKMPPGLEYIDPGATIDTTRILLDNNTDPTIIDEFVKLCYDNGPDLYKYNAWRISVEYNLASNEERNAYELLRIHAKYVHQCTNNTGIRIDDQGYQALEKIAYQLAVLAHNTTGLSIDEIVLALCKGGTDFKEKLVAFLQHTKQLTD